MVNSPPPSNGDAPSNVHLLNFSYLCSTANHMNGTNFGNCSKPLSIAERCGKAMWKNLHISLAVSAGKQRTLSQDTHDGVTTINHSSQQYALSSATEMR
uniref:Uncharacterized protein n=1 Tax=Ascaris lumbricoides TaxID=6252 RepID=A0A0M3IUS0_ASCLU